MLSGALERRASPENPSTSLSNPAEWLYKALGADPTSSGVSVDEESGLEWTAISSGVRLLSGLIASLPFKVFRRLEPGKEAARTHPVYPVIHDVANPEQTAFEFWEMLVGHIPGWGVAYAEKVRNGAGELAELWPIHPDRIQPRRRSDGELFYRVKLPTRTEQRDGRTHADLDADQVLRIPGFATKGLVGESLYKMHSEAIGLGIATERFAAHFFDRGASPSGVLEKGEGTLSDKAYERLRDDADLIYAGLENSHRIAILEDGLSWKQITTDPEKSQLLEGRKFQVNEASRILNIPPHLLGDLERATFSNIEEQNRSFLTYSLNPWLRRIQNRVDVSLLDAGERDEFFVEHVLEELLRPNAEGRAELYQSRFQTGSITPNRILEIENENPVEGGDTPFVPVNMVPLQQALEMSPEERMGLLAAQHGESPEGHELEERAEDVLGDDETEPGGLGGRVRAIEDFMPVFVEAAERLVRGESRNVERMVRRHLEDDEVQTFLRKLDAYYGDDLPEFAREVMGPVFRSLARAVAREAGEAVDEAPVQQATDSFVRDYADAFTRRYSASSRKQLMALVNDARTGESDPATEVRGRLNEWEEGTPDGRPRAERWAEREARQLDNAAAKFAYVAAGVTAFIWRAIGDSCPLCLALDGKIVEVEGVFVREGETLVGIDEETEIVPDVDVGHPPIHSGCDCKVLPSAA